jgi:hypothetical protein
LISSGDGGFGAGLCQHTLGSGEAFLGVGSFHFNPHDDLSLMESVQIMLTDSFAITIGQNEIAKPAGNGAASYQDRNGRQKHSSGNDGRRCQSNAADAAPIALPSASASAQCEPGGCASGTSGDKR